VARHLRVIELDLVPGCSKEFNFVRDHSVLA